MNGDGAGRERPEIWGGVECTVNRVRDAYHDQLEMTGHASRPGDLDLIAGLGIRTLRYPALWERACPEHPERFLWRFTDDRLARIRGLGIRPILGLCHHGSGPRWTGILEPGFAEALAGYARRVAERYPWADAYTPVNEPLTTARFCGLYGHWHPHRRDDRSFVAALLAQCRAIVLAMRAIRSVNPGAILVQTEDLGKAYGTPRLAYQAEFENQRRWLSCDLLCGRVDGNHPLRGYLEAAGASPADLAFFLGNPCPPGVFGFNHYLTSDRFLDDDTAKYPPALRGGNGREAYADVEAVRVGDLGGLGAGPLLREAWDRYRSPLALTEVHLGCTREDQVRWFREAWDSASGLIGEGVDVRAITAWSLFGACEWNSLATRDEGFYEPGAFDVRAPGPRPTALAALIRKLASGSAPDDDVSAAPGWWRRPDRFRYPDPAPPPIPVPSRVPAPDPRPILIAGAAGALARALALKCRGRGLRHVGLPRGGMDIADPASVSRALDAIRPWAVINAAGYARPDRADHEPWKCRRENAEGPGILAEACSRRGIRLMTFSSDQVFGASSDRPFLESDPPSPANAYGRSKAEGESRTLERDPRALVIRAGEFFGPWDRGFPAAVRRALAAQGEFRAPDDVLASPAFLPDFADACLDLFLDGEEGVWHLAHKGAASWASLARRVAAALGHPEETIVPAPAWAPAQRTDRPRYSALGSERGWILPSLDAALERCLAEFRAFSAREG